MDVCDFHSICSVYEALGLFLLVAFRVFVAFRGYWGWAPCGVSSVSSV